MSLQVFADELTIIPGKLREIETEIVEAEWALRQQKFQLETMKAQLLLDGRIDGKNAEVREAQMLQHVGPEELLIATEEAKIEAKKVDRRHWLRVLDIDLGVLGAFSSNAIADVLLTAQKASVVPGTNCLNRVENE